MKVTHHKDLKNYNTFSTPSKCSRFIELENISELPKIWSFFHGNQIPIVLGGGSNVLLNDFISGTLLRPRFLGIDIIFEDQDKIVLEVGAGENWSDLVRSTVERGYFGLENLVDIPGTAGAAPIQNIGAYGVEVSSFVKSVKWYDFYTKQIKELQNSECSFNYRESIFKNHLRNKGIVCSIVLCLHKNVNNMKVSYKDVASYFIEKNKKPTHPVEVMNAISSIRKNKIPHFLEKPNAGSYFKNPVISANLMEKISKKFVSIPHFKIENSFKIPAAWLIEQSGLKGYSLEGVSVNPSQPLVLINAKRKSASKILKLAKHIQETVFNNFGIALEPEVNFIDNESVYE